MHAMRTTVATTLGSAPGSLAFARDMFLNRNPAVADISATSPHHFLVFCHNFANFWRKIKVDSVLES
jgi:hypothetical protein